MINYSKNKKWQDLVIISGTLEYFNTKVFNII